MLCPLRPGSLVYEQLGYKAFGMPGKLAASCSITMQNFGGTTSNVNPANREGFYKCEDSVLKGTFL